MSARALHPGPRTVPDGSILLRRLRAAFRDLRAVAACTVVFAVAFLLLAANAAIPAPPTAPPTAPPGPQAMVSTRLSTSAAGVASPTPEALGLRGELMWSRRDATGAAPADPEPPAAASINSPRASVVAGRDVPQLSEAPPTAASPTESSQGAAAAGRHADEGLILEERSTGGAEAATAASQRGGQQVPAIVDADSTGAGRTPEEESAADEEGCSLLKARQILPLRIRHSTAAVDSLLLPAATAGDDSDTDIAPLADVDPQTHRFPFHVPENPGAQTYANTQWCPGSLEPPPEEAPPIDPRYRALFVIGAQKAGTSWLHHALSLHEAPVYGVPKINNTHNPNWKGGGTRKELQFFNTWPARSTEEFLSMWPPEELAAMRNGTSQKFLFDASPEYLLNAAVAPRMKQMVPQAKIVIVLRDPTTRAFSAWGMKSGWGEYCDNEDVALATLCVERSFEETFNAWHNSFTRPECRFTSPGSNATWGDCFGCRYNIFQYNQCCHKRAAGEQGMLPCFGVPRGFSVLDYSSYAAQIAWWLQFFPPEQLYIVTSEMLQNEVERVVVLNELLDFVGLPDVPRFSAERVNTAKAFNGHYGNLSAADIAAQALVRRFHAPQVRDLRALLARFFPHVSATALALWSSPDRGS